MSGPGRALLVAGCYALVLGVVAAGPSRSTAPALWAGLSPGRYEVGYRRLGSHGTVVHAWYPTPSAGEPMRFDSYLGEESAGLASFLANTGISSVTIDSLFDSRLFASSGRSPIDRLFPLVLVAQGNGGSVIDQVVLCEYLASRGFVVVTTPSPMRETPLEREEQVGDFAQRQADDLAGAASAVASVLPVDTTHIGIVGHSFGARAALLLAMRNPRVRALVSLDGGIGTGTAVAAFRRAPSFDDTAKLPPILHFYEELDAFMTPDFTLLEALETTELMLEPTEGMHHVHFTTYGFAAGVFPELAAATKATPETVEGIVGVTRRTAEFLGSRMGAVEPPRPDG